MNGLPQVTDTEYVCDLSGDVDGVPKKVRDLWWKKFFLGFMLHSLSVQSFLNWIAFD
jgi:hypothetical protein